MASPTVAPAHIRADGEILGRRQLDGRPHGQPRLIGVEHESQNWATVWVELEGKTYRLPVEVGPETTSRRRPLWHRPGLRSSPGTVACAPCRLRGRPPRTDRWCRTPGTGDGVVLERGVRLEVTVDGETGIQGSTRGRRSELSGEIRGGGREPHPGPVVWKITSSLEVDCRNSRRAEMLLGKRAICPSCSGRCEKTRSEASRRPLEFHRRPEP